MKINLLKGSVTYGAATIFSRIAAVVLIPVLTRLLSPVEYGALNMVLTIVTLVNFTATLEIAQAVTLFFSDRKREGRDLYPSTAIRFSLMMYLFFLVFAVIFGGLISKQIGESTINGSIIIYGAMLLGANGIFFFLQNQFRLEFETQKFALVTLGYVLLTSFGAIGGALILRRPAEGVILGQVSGAVIIDVLGVAMLWKRFKPGFDMTKLREMLKMSLPLVPSGLFLLFGQQVPKFILSSYGTMDDIGIYGLAYQIAGFSALAVLGVQTAITPSVLANHNDAQTPKTLGRLFEIFAIVALIFCSFLSIFANELVMIFSIPSYSRAANFVPPLAFAIALNNLYIFFPGKIIRGKTAFQLIATAGSFVVAVVAGFVLVKYDGVRGASFATLLSAFTFFYIWALVSQRLYKLPVNWLKLFLLTAITALVCLVGIFIIPAEVSFLSIVVKCALLLLFSCAIAWGYIKEVWKKYIPGYRGTGNIN